MGVHCYKNCHGKKVKHLKKYFRDITFPQNMDKMLLWFFMDITHPQLKISPI